MNTQLITSHSCKVFEMLGVWTIFSVLLLGFNPIKCAKILGVFPTPSISHQVVFRPLMHELAKRGHEVVIITPDPAFPKGQTPANITEIDVHDISYEHWQDLLVTHDGRKENILQQLINLFEKFTSTFDKQLNTPEVQRILTEEKDSFDLIVAESSIRTALGLGHLLKKPIIQLSSFGTSASYFGFLGAPMHPLIYPSPINERVYNLNMWEKFKELLKHFALDYLMYITNDFDYSVAKRHFGEDMPAFADLHEKYVQMLFLNEHPIWAHNHPVPPNIVFLGGIHQTPDKELPKDLQAYLDSSKNGIIYVSFGTNVKSSLIPLEKVDAMKKVFSKLPYDVLWKWDDEIMPGKPNNVKISKWLPQAQLLKHPKIKLFITQGGLQSTDETINAAVPVIGIPMLGDQWYNTEKYVHHKIGLQLDIHSITEEQFENSVKTVIEDNSYKSNILELRTLMREFPIKPLDLAVWWTEHILQHGGSHLRSPAYKMSLFTYYEVPLILTILSICSVIMFVIVYLIRFILRRIVSYVLVHIRIKIKKT